jgi:hypothetical protein
MSDGAADQTSDLPVVALVEWAAEGLELDDARDLAAESDALYRRIPGLIDARFLGDFDRGVHYYLLTWRDRAALEEYGASDAMTSIRSLAAPHVSGKVSRTILLDYSPPRI